MSNETSDGLLCIQFGIVFQVQTKRRFVFKYLQIQIKLSLLSKFRNILDFEPLLLRQCCKEGLLYKTLICISNLKNRVFSRRIHLQLIQHKWEWIAGVVEGMQHIAL